MKPGVRTSIRDTWWIRGVAAVLAAYFIIGGILFIPPQEKIAALVGVSFALIFLLYPARKGSPEHRPSVVDVVLCVAALAIGLYFFMEYDAIQRRAGRVTTPQLVAGFTAIIVSLEVARRLFGIVLPIIAVVFIGYNLFGPYMPGALRQASFPIEQIIDINFRNVGIFGLVASTYARFVFLFIILGAILQRLGIIEQISNLAVELTRGMRGGPAKAATVSSAGIGSVIGSGVANIGVTGPISIPVMRRAGLSNEKAGAVEVVASIGGQLLPPVMGAGAFLMAEFTRTPYADVVAIAVVPAILYYVALLATVHFESAKVTAPPRGRWRDMTRWRESLIALRDASWSLAPVVLLIYLLITRMSAGRAVIYCLGLAFVLMIIRERKASGVLPNLFNGLAHGTFNMLPIAATAGVIGIVIAMIDLPGLAPRFTSAAMGLIGDNLFVAYLVVLGISLVLGMGTTVTAAYALVAVLAASMFTELGVPLLLAHLVIFWLSMDSSITPPFALGAYVAAGISGGNAIKTGLWSFMYGKALYIVPLLILFTPLMTGTPGQRLLYAVTGGAGLVCFSAAMAGYFRERLGWIRRALLLGAAGTLLFPSYVLTAVGAGIVVVLWFVRVGREEQAAPADEPQRSM